MSLKKSKIKNQKSKLKFKIQNFEFWIIILIFGFWILDLSYAAPCYGTKMPKKKKFFAGLQSHTVFKRYLEDEYGKLRSQQELFLLSYGVYDWLSIDLKGGTGYIKQHPVGSDEIDYPSWFGGGYGFRLRLYDQQKLNLVVGFQHISIHPKTVSINNAKNKAVLDDWQISCLVSRNFAKFTPYLGTKWSRVDYIHWVDRNRKRRMSDLTKGIGLVLGMDFSITERVWLNLEGQLFDGEACAFSVNYSF